MTNDCILGRDALTGVAWHSADGQELGHWDGWLLQKEHSRMKRSLYREER